jgi:hypothetical protein
MRLLFGSSTNQNGMLKKVIGVDCFCKNLDCSWLDRKILSRTTTGLSHKAVQAISQVLGTAMASTQNTSCSTDTTIASTRGRCFLCIKAARGVGYKRQKYKVRIQKQRCSMCHKHVCNGHSDTTKVCNVCVGNDSASHDTDSDDC